MVGSAGFGPTTNRLWADRLGLFQEARDGHEALSSKPHDHSVTAMMNPGPPRLGPDPF